jgi:hypothetical protein
MGAGENEKPKQQSRLWYVRRAGRVRGPFPPGQISREILIGRIRDGDELSQDRELWRPLAQLPQLMPEAMRHAGTREDQQRLTLARLREDERSQDRRHGKPAAEGTDRRRNDRRNVESLEVVAHRERVARWAAEPGEERNLLLPAAVIMTTIVILAMYFLWYRPAGDTGVRDCAAAPAPGINWNSCDLAGRNLNRADLSRANLANAVLLRADLHGARLDGADLSYANLEAANLGGTSLQAVNLKGAVLRGADLSGSVLQEAELGYADLLGANLGGARFTGARLGKTIWVDGRVCAADSVGECR